MRRILEWFKELIRCFNKVHCPHCGYYCHGKSIWCTPPLPKGFEEWKKANLYGSWDSPGKKE